MRRSLAPLLVGIAVGATTLGGVSYAATGGSFLLGKSNTSGAQTILRNTATTPILALSTSRSGQVPLAVSANAGKATNLNADKLDGLDSTVLALSTGQTGTLYAQSELIDVDDDGIVDNVLAAFVDCPAGTKVTGGGFENYTGYPTIISEQSDNGWFVASTATAGESGEDLYAAVTCYNPRGAVPGANTTASRAKPSGPTHEAIASHNSLSKLAAK
jgi:hypothetical protein